MYKTEESLKQQQQILEESIRATENIKGDVELGELYDLAQIDWTWSRQQKIEAVIHELKTVGFFLITNVPGYDEKDLVRWGKWFCAQPEDVKKQYHKRFWNPENPNIYRGLAPFIDNDPSHVEIYDMGLDLEEVRPDEREYSLHEQTPWPDYNDEAKEFTAYMKEHYKLRVRVASELVSLIAEGLGKTPDFFDGWYEHSTLSTYSINHYMPRDRGVVKNDLVKGAQYKILIAQHTDSGFVTLLSTLGYPGLQVLVGDEFKSARPVEHSFVINIGDMLSRITNYILKATLHRVIDIGDDRFSSPFFFEPHYQARIPSSIMDLESLRIIENDSNKAREANEQEKQFEDMLYGDYLIDKITGYCLSY